MTLAIESFPALGARAEPRRGRAPKPYGVAGFDSGAALMRATARALRGRDFPAVGHARILQHVVRWSELAPRWPRRAAYAFATGFEAIPRSAVRRVNFGEIAEWATSLYPERRYPAIIIGSAAGALSHLAAAIHAPLLPQTFLIAVRRKGGSIDDAKGDLEQARESGETLLAHNPDVQLHQMHDPNQDRLSLEYVTYFRPKFLRLPEAYRRFIAERLEPDGVVIIADCRKRWPTTRVGPRYLFQFGAVGGIHADDYFARDERIASYLRRFGVDEVWDPPEPDGESVEAEWGFEPALSGEIEALAREKGLRVVRLQFEDPQDASPLVADFHRAWLRRRGLRADRLLVESFILVEPYWAMRTGSVPFWTTFAVQPSLEGLEAFLDQSEPYADIRIMLFPHGTESMGLARIEQWRAVLQRARRGGFVGVNEEAFPYHFSALARYHMEMQEIPARHPIPGPLPFAEFEQFCRDAGNRYRCRLAA